MESILITILLMVASAAAGASIIGFWLRQRWHINYLRTERDSLAKQLEELRVAQQVQPSNQLQSIEPVKPKSQLPLLSLTEVQALLREAKQGEQGIIENIPGGLWALLSILMLHAPPKAPYSFVLGWTWGPSGAEVRYASFHGDAKNFALHPIVTGKSGAGKDKLVFLWLASLLMQYTPDQVKLCWISKKRTDANFWRGKAHLWREPAVEDNEIEAATKALIEEVDRRDKLIAEAGASSWESYQGPEKLPLLVVYLSELNSVALVVGKKDLDVWLNSFLGICRSSGVRVIIAPQSVNNQSTNWRGNTELTASGVQSSVEYDKPSVGLYPDETRRLGGLPPSEIPGPGIFTVRIHRTLAAVRVPNLTDAERHEVIAYLPNAAPVKAAAPAMIESVVATMTPVETPPLELVLRPIDLVHQYRESGKKQEELRDHPVVIQAVTTTYHSLSGKERSGREITKRVFESQPGVRDGWTGTRQDSIVIPILTAKGLTLPTTSEKAEERSEQIALTTTYAAAKTS